VARRCRAGQRGVVGVVDRGAGSVMALRRQRRRPPPRVAPGPPPLLSLPLVRRWRKGKVERLGFGGAARALIPGARVWERLRPGFSTAGLGRVAASRRLGLHGCARQSRRGGKGGAGGCALLSRSGAVRGLAGDASERGHGGGEKGKRRGRKRGRQLWRLVTRQGERQHGRSRGGGERKLRVAMKDGGRGKLTGGAVTVQVLVS
jgi:hypothetical protein